MAKPIRQLKRANDPLFLLGLSARVILILFLVPMTHEVWFVPFIDNFIANPDIDPWRSHLASGGNPSAFPYGPVMWLMLLPSTALGALGGEIFSGYATPMTAIGFGVGILIFDFLLLLALLEIVPGRSRLVILLYWLSPIVLYVNYWHGQVDIVPVLLLTAALVAIKRQKFTLAGVILGAAFAAKLSMILALPFILIYFLRNNRLRRFSPKFIAAVAITTAVLQGPYMFSSAVRSMVIDTPEAQKIYDLSLDLGSFEILLLPLGYGLVVYAFWQLRRMSFGLLMASLGLGFFLVLLLSPAAPGWFLWVVPLLVMHQAQSGRKAIIMTAGFSLLLIIFNLLHSSGASIRLADADLTAPLIETFGSLTESQLSLLLTALLASGAVLAYRMSRDGIRDSDHFGLRSRPFVLGIAGDSGSGKDTLANAIQGLFGSHSVAQISGDDYHMWDRDQPMWENITHLNPRGNDLAAMTNRVIDLAESRTVTVTPYDHSIGRFARAVSLRHNDFVVVSGLLVYFTPQLRERCDARIFLDMNEDLRRHLKIRRDVESRGHTVESVDAALETRADDAERFVKPQVEHAEVVFGLEPIRPAQLNDETSTAPIHLRLRISLRDSLYHERLVRLLIGGCGLNVDHDLNDTTSAIELVVSGEVSGEDLNSVAAQLIPQSEELLDVEPVWQDGMIGVMQLVVMAQAAQILRDRLA
jgi:uridine kinase